METVVTYKTTRRVEFSDTDMAGIAHFSRFFLWMEEIEHEYLRTRGLSVMMNWDGQPIGWPRVSAHCDYVRPVKFEQVLDVTITVAKIGTKSVTYDYLFSCDGQPVAQGQLITCCVTGEKGKMKAFPIPDEMRKKILGKG